MGATLKNCIDKARKDGKIEENKYNKMKWREDYQVRLKSNFDISNYAEEISKIPQKNQHITILRTVTNFQKA